MKHQTQAIEKQARDIRDVREELITELQETDMKHQIKDNKTGQIVKTYTDKKAARRACEKMNQAYGACRYTLNGVAL